jgi:hypothetical protein
MAQSMAAPVCGQVTQYYSAMYFINMGRKGFSDRFPQTLCAKRKGFIEPLIFAV